jgi:hypothetical protein
LKATKKEAEAVQKPKSYFTNNSPSVKKKQRNPFDSDDDRDDVEQGKPVKFSHIPTMQRKAITNPFDDDDEEEVLQNFQPQGVKAVQSNPFDDDD